MTEINTTCWSDVTAAPLRRGSALFMVHDLLHLKAYKTRVPETHGPERKTGGRDGNAVNAVIPTSHMRLQDLFLF